MQFKIQRLAMFASTALGMSLAVSGVASAQDAQASGTTAAEQPSGGLEEIVVTAQKRSENLQNVPIAISAFTSDALAQRGISDVSAVANLAPNVTLDSGSFAGGSQSVLSAFIRGIGQSDFAFNFDPGVGVYVDGVYLGRTIGANVGLFDVERIEVLKGPQGTLFGRNTIGGAVNIVTMTPGDEFKASAEVTTGRYNRLDVRGIVSVPLGETVSASLAFGSKNRDGYMKRIPFNTAGFFTDPISFAPRINSPEEEGGQNEYNLRGKLRFAPSEDFNVVISADYSRIKSTNIAQKGLFYAADQGLGGLYNACIATPAAVLDVIGLGAVCGPRVVIGTSLAGANADADPNNNRLTWDSRFVTGNKDTTYANGNSRELTKTYGGAVTMTYDISPDMAIKSITGYRELKFLSAADLDGSPLQFLEINSRVNQRQFSQELQVTGSAVDGKLKYAVGAFYFDEKSSTDDYVGISELLLLNAPARLRAKSIAGYGQIDYRASDLLGFTIGARYTEERKTIFVGQQDLNALAYKASGCFPVSEACRVLLGFPNPQNPLAYAPAVVPSAKFTNFAPKLGVQLHLDPDTMIYASWSKGYKSGGWTTRLSNPVQVVPQFSPEKATSYELGLKADLLDSRLRFNGAGFFTKYNDIQLNFQEGVSPVIKNAGDAEIWGLEGEITAIVSDEFTLRSSVGYLHNKYTRLDPGALGLTLASKLPKTPSWKFTVGPQYEAKFANGSAIVLVADFTHATESFNDTENTVLLKKAAFDELSASITYRAPEHWRLTVGGTNLLNNRYLIAGQNQLGGVGYIYGTYNRPVEWYASIRADF